MKMFIFFILLQLISIYSVNCEASDDHPKNTSEFIKNAGFKVETHNVTTKDGYILTMFRIPGAKGAKPIFLQHGFLGSSNSWVINGNASFAFLLSNEKYDIWMGNFRGNNYSSLHVNMSKQDEKYWDYSFNELGVYDLSAMLNYVTKKTKQQIIYIGYSMGVTSFLVMSSEKPEMNKNIRIAFLLGPVAYMKNVGTFFQRNFLLPLFKLIFNTKWIAKQILGNEKYATGNKNSEFSVKTDITMSVASCNINHFKEMYVSEIVRELEGGTSVRNVKHFLQELSNGDFLKYDFGDSKMNLKVHKRNSPPIYNLTRIDIPVVLISSIDDPLTPPEDIEILVSKLPRLFKSIVIKYENFCHLDIAWGKYAEQFVYEPLLEALNEFENITNIETSNSNSSPGKKNLISVYCEKINEASELGNMIEMIEEAGFPAEEHSVTTLDGFILKMFRIRGPPGSKTILLQHGIFATSYSWVFTQNNSLAFLLANEKYDVWLGNFRGNNYSRENVYFSRNEKNYWDFSFNELGVHDLPTMIDYITDFTNQPLIYIGYSMGATSFLVMASEKPEMASKIRIAFLIAPVLLSKCSVNFFQKLALPIIKLPLYATWIWDGILGKYQHGSVSRTPKLVKLSLSIMKCDKNNILKFYRAAAFKQLSGRCSAKNLKHFLQQLSNDDFRKFDYGKEENLIRYHQSKPPKYDLTKIKIPIVPIFSMGDKLTPLEDMKTLTSKLPNVYKIMKIRVETFCHVDLIWGKNAPKILNKPLLGVLEKFERNQVSRH
ncbi:uncharacterized protein LOC122499756 [Leptopilina heterotoma]|uniref:uncharacterized protein LOC122499756 n=1 Tax=Leptopilina heterotoma TaxID=63436 RepID=UPI001CA8E028|nr:uncharacterized protein LOC122499756 [Leptopilina heterotoma]